jgi:hypothetical protein
MTIQEFNINLQLKFQLMINGLPAIVTEIATMNIAPSIKERVETEGKDQDGGRFGQYSTTEGYFPVKTPGLKKLTKPYGKTNEAGNQFSKFQSGKKEGQEHTTKYLPGGYDQYKREVDRHIGTKNFSLTGAMWRGFGISNRAEVINEKVIAELGGKNKYSQDLIDANSDREEMSIIAANAAEAQLFVEMLQDYVNTSLI